MAVAFLGTQSPLRCTLHPGEAHWEAGAACSLRGGWGTWRYGAEPRSATCRLLGVAGTSFNLARTQFPRL